MNRGGCPTRLRAMRRRNCLPSSLLAGIAFIAVMTSSAAANYPLTALDYNDLGMHCMNQDIAEIMLLPPYNTLHAQVVDRTGEHPPW